VTEASEVSRVWGAVVRRWPVVLIAVLIGAVAFGVWGSTRAPELRYTASAKLRVADTGVPNMPTLDTVTSYANSARLKAAVVASTGLDPQGVSVAAAQDPKDKRGIVISASAPKPDTAAKWADAAAEQTRVTALGMLAAPIGLERARARRLEARVAQLEAEIPAMRAAAAKSKDAQAQSNYLVAAQTLEDSLAAAQEDLDVSHYALQGYLAWVAVTPAAAASKQSAQGVVLSDVLRGGLVGLFVGVLIAAVLENRRSGSRA
jgi:uncharacterized protein involved in exopolysaccharide biosynthesis